MSSTSISFRKKFVVKLISVCFLRSYSQRIRSNDFVVANYVKRQMTDEFSKLSKIHNYRARSAFKLLQMNKKFKIIKGGIFICFFQKYYFLLDKFQFYKIFKF